MSSVSDQLDSTSIFRLVHVDNLPTLLSRGGLHAPDHVPADGLAYHSIHDVDVQSARHQRAIPCGPDGTITDYVPFYLGRYSPMLFRLHTGRVANYDQGQRPVLHLVSSVGDIQKEGLGFAFSDGHGLASFTRWYDDLARLDQVDWETVRARYWASDKTDNDRQRRKQAEFLVHRFCPWKVIRGIVVIDQEMQGQVEEILAQNPEELRRPIAIRRKWYY